MVALIFQNVDTFKNWKDRKDFYSLWEELSNGLATKFNVTKSAK